MTDLDRALGALYGLALGDALGMPTQTLPRERIAELFGRVEGLLAGPEENELSAGLAAGTVTDDTDQAVLVARALVDGGGSVDPLVLARRLLAWQEKMAERGSLDLLGPSTTRALEAVRHGVPVEESGRRGDTNGAAMRIAGVGVAVPPEPAERLVQTVADVSRVTHGTRIAIAGAAAVAATVSAGVGGASLEIALEAGARAAELGAGHGFYTAGADVSRRIRWAVGTAAAAETDAEALDAVHGLVGTGLATQESVPAAFALLWLAGGDPWRAGLLAAGIGGDTDTIGAMAGAMGGAISGVAALPPEPLALVREVNDLDLEPLARDLLTLRAAAG